MTAVVSNIDRKKPILQVEYSTTSPTNSVVKASVSANEPVYFTNNSGNDSYMFEDNGTFEFTVVDRAGNEASIVATVNNIDKIPPKATIKYSTTALTKDDVIATIEKEKDEDFIVINNGKKEKYIFTENGSIKFYIQDLEGNVVEALAVVNNIDKSKPKITLSYSEKEPTQNKVVVTIKSDKPLTFLNNPNNKVRFTKNGIKCINSVDNLGNKVQVKIRVGNIDNEGPTIDFISGERLLINKGDC
ncbi:MAG: hypothetical protein N4A63_02325 [Vallitalea sp.]|jgi:hypothetical protein|nr:hypothetical protein [Vallitalea sp.]